MLRVQFVKVHIYATLAFVVTSSIFSISASGIFFAIPKTNLDQSSTGFYPSFLLDDRVVWKKEQCVFIYI